MSNPGTAPEEVSEQLLDMSPDVRVAVLADPAGGLVAVAGAGRTTGRRLAGLACDLLSRADSSGGPISELEAQTGGGAVFVVRTPGHTLACVARRLALPALVLYDMRRALVALEGSA